MAFAIRITPAAERAIAKLPRSVQAAVFDRLEVLAVDPRPVGCEKVEGLARYEVYRLKVAGSYRLLYQVRDEVAWILVVKVADRKEVYQRLDDLKRLLQ
jgi:mRNA interferase RelE/StbE